MRTLLLLLLFMAYTPFLPAEKAASTPKPLSDEDRVSLLEAMRSVDRIMLVKLRAEKVIADSELELAKADAAIQRRAAQLQQEYSAVGYNLDNDLNWVAAQAPVKQEKPDAATKPESVPDR